MQMLKMWLVTTIVFFMGDIFWLYAIMRKFFVPQVRHLMNVTEAGVAMNYASALAAYLLLSTALTVFVVVPFYTQALSKVFAYGAFLGLCLYGVYEFTNHATLYNWPLMFLIVDIAWGTTWCGAVAVVTVSIIRRLS